MWPAFGLSSWFRYSGSLLHETLIEISAAYDECPDFIFYRLRVKVVGKRNITNNMDSWVNQLYLPKTEDTDCVGESPTWLKYNKFTTSF